jgi:hypothetical protein
MTSTVLARSTVCDSKVLETANSTTVIYYFQKLVGVVVFGSSNIPDKNSKIGRKFYYLEELNSKNWKENLLP